MKMSDVFDLPLDLRNDLVHFTKTDTCYFKVESVKSRDEELQVTYCIHNAVNNHDRLIDALKDLVCMLQFDPEDVDSHEWQEANKLLKELGHEI